MSPVELGAGFSGLPVDHPWLLAVLILAAALALAASWRGRPPRIAWPALEEVRAAGGRRHDPAAWLSRGLRLLALLALAVVVAGPHAQDPRPPPPGEGIDLALVVDTSLSMRALDAEVDGEWRTRLDLAREVVRRFALHRVADGDRVGLVVFGETAFTQCPLTSDGRLLATALGRVVPGMAGEATALGDALALAVKRVSFAAGPDVSRGDVGRVVVLLTDGRSNAGVIPVDVATALARERGIRVHTVGIGSEGEVAIAGSQGGAGRGLRFERHDLDSEGLSRIAEATGGRSFEARTPADLEAVYREIDALERIPREEREALRGHEPVPEPFLALAGVLLLGEVVTTRVLRRRLP
ncbi:MAG: VWA domain-containing protein [Myxococcota bacterium]